MFNKLINNFKILHSNQYLFSLTKKNFSKKLDSFTIQVQKTYLEEPVEQKRSRLLYQSRKRGMLENDLILSYFAKEYLDHFNEKQLEEYDFLINNVSNDWDLYYWATGKQQIPDEFNNSVMHLLKTFTNNNLKQCRSVQPPLY